MLQRIWVKSGNSTKHEVENTSRNTITEIKHLSKCYKDIEKPTKRFSATTQGTAQENSSPSSIDKSSETSSPVSTGSIDVTISSTKSVKFTDLDISKKESVKSSFKTVTPIENFNAVNDVNFTTSTPRTLSTVTPVNRERSATSASRSLALLFNVDDDDQFAEMILLSSRKERQSEYVLPTKTERNTMTANMGLSISGHNPYNNTLMDIKEDFQNQTPEMLEEQKNVFRGLLLDIYQRCSPDKVPKVDSFMTIYFNGYEEKLFQQLKTKYSLSKQEIVRFDFYMDNYQPIQKSIVTPRDALLLEQAQEEMSFKRSVSSKLGQSVSARQSIESVQSVSNKINKARAFDNESTSRISEMSTSHKFDKQSSTSSKLYNEVTTRISESVSSSHRKIEKLSNNSNKFVNDVTTRMSESVSSNHRKIEKFSNKSNKFVNDVTTRMSESVVNVSSASGRGRSNTTSAMHESDDLDYNKFKAEDKNKKYSKLHKIMVWKKWW